MKYLSLDFGLSKIGLALSDGFFALPLKVISNHNWEKELIPLLLQEKVETIIIGLSEGKSKDEAKKFGDLLKSKTNIPIIYWDETLTTKEAQIKMRESGKNKKYRKKMEDAAAAALILQSYLDNR